MLHDGFRRTHGWRAYTRSAQEAGEGGHHVPAGVVRSLERELLIVLPSAATRAPAQSAGGSRGSRDGRNRCTGASPSRSGWRVESSPVASRADPPSRGGRAPSSAHGFYRNIRSPAAARPCRGADALPTRLSLQLRALIRHQTEQACWDDRLERPRRRRIKRKRPWALAISLAILCGGWVTAQLSGRRE